MPVQELPEEFLKPIGSPSNSSLSSNSSDVIINAHYVRDSRSISISSSNSTNIQDDDSIEANASNVNYNNIRNRNVQIDVGFDDDDNDEDKYQPIKLPSEPTLEELLRQVTGRADVSSVEEVKLRIISSAISLQRLPYFMPHLRHLNLEGSMLFSLRDLGCDLTSLVYLNISRCGLKSLDGTNGLSTLNELVADYNQIEEAGPCSNLPQIRKISLISNKIRDFHGMMFLGLCNQLRILDMTNNTITQKENYRDIVRRHIPQLAILDQTPYEDVNDELKFQLTTHNFERSSTNILRRIDELNHVQMQNEERPMTAEILPVTHISIGRRPTTADASKTKHDVSVGASISGSVIAIARRPKKLRTAWGSSASSSSSFSSSDSSNQVTPSNSAFNRNNRTFDEDSSDVLLENSRKLREKTREMRGKYKNN